MALDSSSVYRARGNAIQGGLFAFFLLIFALLSFRAGRFEASLTLVPLAGVYLWPRKATSALSTVFIFLLGFSVDVFSGGPIGLSAFLYLFLYGVFRPDLKGREKGLYTTWSSFTSWVFIALGITWVVGAVFISGRTNIGALVTQGCVAVFLFPLIFVIRNGFYRIISDRDGAEADI